MILYDDLDDRFYINEGIVYAQTTIPKDTVIPIQGICVRKDSVADQCTEYLDDYKFATLFNYDINDYEYYIICLGYPALFTAVGSETDANVSLEYDENENVILKVLRDIKENEEIMFIGEIEE